MHLEALESRLAPATASLNLPGSGYSAHGDGGVVMSFPLSTSALANGLSSANIAVTFPTGVFAFPSGSSAATAEVTCGSVLVGGSANWNLSANAPADGVLNIQLSAKTGHTLTGNVSPGSLLLINFPVANNFDPPSTASETISVVGVNSGFHTQIISAPGSSYTLSPAPPYAGMVSITNVVEQPPTITSPQAYTTEANASINQPAPGILTGAGDPQGQTLAVHTINGAAYTPGTTIALPSGAMLTVQGSGAFAYVPPANFVGADSITFTVADQNGNVSSTGTANFTMFPTLRLVPETSPNLTPGQAITEDVVLDNPNPAGGVGPLTAFNLAITYDPDELSTASDGSQIAPGMHLPSTWTFTANAQTAGAVGIAAFGSGSGADLITGPAPLVLATIQFTVTSTATTTTDIDLVPSVSAGTSSASTGITGSGGLFPLNPPVQPAFVNGVDTSLNVTGTTTILTVGPGSLPGSDVNAAYNQSFAASNGNGTYTFSASGTLPPGLTLSSAGVLSGTPTAAGSFDFTVHASDTAGDMGKKAYTISINPPVTITTATMPGGEVNVAFAQTISAAGGSGSYSYSTIAGTLPAGLTLSSSGVLSGTPQAAGSFTFTVAAGDSLGGSASHSYLVTIAPQLMIATTTLANGDVSAPYSQTITAMGGSGAYAFTYSSGILPAGLTLSTAGVLTGTPTVVGTYNFSVTAADALGGSTSQSYTVTIYPAVAITTATLSNWTVNQAGYSQTIGTTGGSGAFTFATTSGTVPAGLTLSSSGMLSGTPTAVGSVSFTVTATDTLGGSSSQSYTVTINPVLSITTATLPDWTVNAAYDQTISTTGGTETMVFATTSGTLPTGLMLDSSGVLSGTPTATGSFTFSITATDISGADFSQSYTVTINPAVVITTTTLAAWTAAIAGYSQTISATGGTAATIFSSMGTLPGGLTLNSSAGVLSGTPLGSGTYTFTVTATDTVGASAGQSFTVTINPAVGITTPALASGTINVAYSQTIVAVGGTGSVTFSLTGTLPAGLTLSSSGVLSGLPTVYGSFSILVTANDTLGATVTRAYTLTIKSPPVTITTTFLASWTAKQPGYTQTITATGGVGALTFSETGTVPGLSLSSAGVLAGTPTVSGSFSVSVTVTDSLGVTALSTLGLTIHPALALSLNPQRLVTFTSFNGSNGEFPSAGLAEDSYGNLYGAADTTSYGEVFEVPKASGNITPVAAFFNGSDPGGLIEDSSGDLFGTTSGGGSGYGTVFEVPAGSGGTIRLLASFGSNGGTPFGRLILDSSGNLFGTTANSGGGGTVFEVAAGSGTVTTLATFNSSSSSPNGFLIEDGSGNLFGATGDNSVLDPHGTVFEVPAGSGAFITLASFDGTNGDDPQGGLFEDSSGNLFGATAYGGDYNYGTVFKVPAGGGTITTLASFNAPGPENPDGAGLIEDSSGNLIGTTSAGGQGYGTVFEVPASGGTITALAVFNNTDGSVPWGSLVLDSSGNLFGTTWNGGTFGNGTVFELPKGSGSIITLTSFKQGPPLNPPPSYSNGLIEDSSGNFFGTTQYGGTSGEGSVFELPKGSGTLTTLTSFPAFPSVPGPSALIVDSSGNLFGTTGVTGGAAVNYGSVFEVPAGSGTIITLSAFSSYYGGSNGGLVEDSNGDLFGTTNYGQGYYDGAVYEVSKGSGTVILNTLVRPAIGGLVLDKSGDLFGVSQSGGANGTGMVFELRKGSPTFTTYASFGSYGPTTSGPNGGLIEDSSGNLFGVTAGGGTYSDGTVYEVPAGGGSIITLASFNGIGGQSLGLPGNGSDPFGPLIEDSSGNLFGTTQPYSGGTGSTTVFELAAGSGTITTLATLSSVPNPGLVMDSSGYLYGTTEFGGTDNEGTLFEVGPPVISATVETPYSLTLSASGGVGPYSFSASGGSLPPGLTLSSAGVLQGLPTTTGTSIFNVTVTDSGGASASETIAVVINPPVTISPTTLPTGEVNVNYSQTISATGGTGALTLSITAGALPPGLGFSGTTPRVLEGTPTSSGTFTFTVRETDSVGAIAEQTYTVLINPAVALPAMSLPAWTQNYPGYNQTIVVSGGTGPFSFGFGGGGGFVPAGLTLSSAGVLGGTPTTYNIAGTYTIPIFAYDSLGTYAHQSYTLILNPPVTITTTALPNWTVNHGYRQTVRASGGTGPLTLSETGTPVPGLTLSSAGVLSGMPASTGTFTFTITATDSIGAQDSQDYTVTINPAVAITTTLLVNWPLNQPGYRQTVSASGGTGALTFSATGTLPPGLTLSTGGILSGTPSAAGAFTFTVSATDTTGASGSNSYTITVNVWTPLTNLAPDGTGTMLLLTDGTVMVQEVGDSNVWYQLTPDSSGSYANGTWTQLASMSTPRLYGGSVVLPSGKVLYVGGEYTDPSNPNQTPTNTGEIYDPISNTWSAIASFPQSEFGDDPLEVLANGSVLAGYINGPATYLYDPSTNTWSAGGTKLRSDQTDEETWVKLPDGGILSYDIYSSISTGVNHAQRYVPATNSWVDAGTLPVALSSDSVHDDLGPALELPDGRVLQFGANGNTALYSPATNSWSAGPVIPNGLVADDGPAAILPNGHVIFAADMATATQPTEIFDYDPVANTISQSLIPAPLTSDLVNLPSYWDRMLVLPTGEVLFTDSSKQLWIYDPSAVPETSWRPTISNVTYSGSQTYTLTGTQLNGLSEGASYGDDAQMASNYPIVELRSATAVYTARTFGWTSQVATGSTPVTTQFTLPAGLPGGTYALTVVANGIASAPQNFTVLALSPAALSAATVGNPYSLSLAVSNGSGSATFSETGTLPPGLSLSPGGVLAGTPTASGAYSFTVTAADTAGNAGSKSYTVTVNPPVTITTATLTNWTISQLGYSQTIKASGGTGSLTFAAPLDLPPGLTLSSTGILSGTPITAGSYTFTVTATDTIGASSNQTYTVIINLPVTLTATLPSWTVNLPGYTATILASGGTGTLTFSQTGMLPPGLTFTSGSMGVLSGTPTVAGAYTFTVTASDAVGASGSATCTLKINLPTSLGITTLATFSGSNGADSQSGLIEDSSGNVFGTTYSGGLFGYGTLFELPAGSGTVIDLAAFNGTGGGNPAGPPALDSHGNLYGITETGGAFGNGTLFEVPKGGGSVTTLVNFNGTSPAPGLTIDSQGNLFGATTNGGPAGAGSLFELPSGSGMITTLATFNSANGASPNGLVFLDRSGNLFGTTTSGGASGYGTVFELPGGSGTITTLAAFNFTNGAGPLGGLVEDGAGDLFGTTRNGGVTLYGTGYGTVFELPSNGALTTLATFNGSNGANPAAGLTLDGSGNLFGTTVFGGTLGLGTIFEVPGGSGTIVTLGNFNSSNGANPSGGLVLDTRGNLLGTTSLGGSAGSGTIFELVTTLPDGTVNQPLYSQTFNSSGGTGAVSFSANPALLPPGITLTAAGVLSGTPTRAGTYHFVVTDTDSLGVSDNHTWTVTINPAVTITTTSLPKATVGPAYRQTISASGGSGSLAFSTVGTLPPGLSLSSTGVLSGTPTLAGTYTFSILATDAVGAVASQTYNLVIFAIGPSTLSNWTVNHGGYSQTITASGGTGPYIITETWPLPPGLTLTSAGILSGKPTTAGSYTFLVTATDATGTSDNEIYTVTINAAVTITTSTLTDWGLNQPGYNATIRTSGGTGVKTFATIGSVPAGLALSVSGVLSGTPTSVGTFLFAVTATDTVSAVGSAIYAITIVPGTVMPGQIIPSLDPATAGTPYEMPLPGLGGSSTATVTGGTLPPGMTVNGAGVLSGTPTTAGTYTFNVTVTDAQGHTTNVQYTIVVAPGPLTQYDVTVPGSSTVAAGSAFQVTVQEADALGNAVSDSGPPAVIATISPSAPGFPLTVPINSSGFGYFLATLPTVGNYTISVAPELSKLFLTGTAPPVTVVPGPAARMSFLVQPANTPTGNVLPPLSVQILDLNGNVVTTDNTDTVTISIASGPGALVAGSTLTAAVRNGVATFSNLVLTTPGAYTLSAVVPSYFIATSAPFTVLPLAVVAGSFTGTPSGFALQFNAAFLVNSVTPALYGSGFGARASVSPTVTLTQISGTPPSGATLPFQVPGSLIVNTASNSLTFVDTDTASVVNSGTPLLPDGTYTAVVHGSAATNGIQALNNGGFLDGLGTGVAGSGDFVATFTVRAAGEDVLWVPATADGPGQPLNAPGNNQIGGGYPVYLSDSTGTVTSVLVTLNYNPALLSVTGVTGPGFALLATSTPGHAILQYSGPAVPKGSQIPIGYITASVPGGTAAAPVPYRAKDLLHLSGALLNGGAIPLVTSDALHLVAYVGDGDGNGSYSSNDAVLITRAALQIDSGFAAYPLVDPVIVADTDGAGYIPADAGLQANEAGVNVPTTNLPNPPIPAGVVFQTIGNNVDPMLSLGVRGQGSGVSSEGIVVAAVNLDDAHPAGSSGLIEAHLALTYDPRQFTVSAADVHLGSVLAAGSGWSVTPTIDPVTGQIAIALSSQTPIQNAVGGSLVTIDFHLTRDDGVGARDEGLTPAFEAIPLAPNPSPLAPILLVASATPNGEPVLTELEDAQGTFTLTPAPTNTFDPRIDSFVALTATPPASPVRVGGTQEAMLSTAIPVESQAAGSRSADTSSGFDSSSNLPELDDTPLANPETMNPELRDRAIIVSPIIAPEAMTTQFTTFAVPLAAITTYSVGVQNLGASITGMALPCGGVIVVNALACSGQLLPNPSMVSAARGAIDRVFADRELSSPLGITDLDRLNWDEVGNELDAQATAKLTKVLARRESLGMRSPEVVADQIDLDQCFAEAADDIGDQ